MAAARNTAQPSLKFLRQSLFLEQKELLEALLLQFAVG